MKQITIKIECKETTCGKCRLRGLNPQNYGFYPYCTVFKKDLKVTRSNDFKRLQECIEAEGKCSKKHMSQ